MTNRVLCGAALAVILGACILTLSSTNPPAAAAELGAPPLVVDDSYWFGLTTGTAVSGPVIAVGPYPWVEVKVDNNDANVYQINLQHVVRIKHLTK